MPTSGTLSAIAHEYCLTGNTWPEDHLVIDDTDWMPVGAVVHGSIFVQDWKTAESTRSLCGSVPPNWLGWIPMCSVYHPLLIHLDSFI